MKQMRDIQMRIEKDKLIFNSMDIFVSQYYTQFPKAANF